jgi:ubiquinone/menaquinone biosynthesis C-methylase UbiE
MEQNIHPGNVPQTIIEQMKSDWNARAQENSKWFINTIRDQQTERDFDQNGNMEVKRLVSKDLLLLTGGRDPRNLRLLEIGCGTGRMTRALANIFGEVNATDVSGEMIKQAAERLHDCHNIIFRETNGVDFKLFDDQSFDVIFCAFVYQHVPTAEVIRNNLADAYRVLRAGGVFKFQTNGVANEAFRNQSKDTWTGEVFGEDLIRSLARQLGAQMMSISGNGTQYCWTLWRRSLKVDTEIRPQLSNLRLISVPKSSIEKPRYRRQSLVISGVDINKLDVNNVTVKLGSTSIEPCYTGPALGYRKAVPQVQVDFNIPIAEPAGSCSLTLLIENNVVSTSIPFEVPPLPPVVPRIELITNGKDGALDIETDGPKSHVRLFVDGISAWPDLEKLDVMVGRKCIKPDRISFVPGNSLHMVEFTIIDIPPGKKVVRLVLGNLYSENARLIIKSKPFRKRVYRYFTESVKVQLGIRRIKNLFINR